MLLKEEYCKQLQQVLEKNTDIAVANYFAENALMAYEDDTAVSTLDERAKLAYDGMKKCITKFISDILMMNIMVNGVSCAAGIVYLPEGDLKISAGVNVSAKSCEAKPNQQELIRTKMGYFDAFTWKMICDIEYKNNPLKIFFKHMDSNIKFILNKTGITEADLADAVIAADMMEQYHIQEPVELHRMIPLYHGVSQFCK